MTVEQKLIVCFLTVLFFIYTCNFASHYRLLSFGLVSSHRSGPLNRQSRWRSLCNCADVAPPLHKHTLTLLLLMAPMTGEVAPSPGNHSLQKSLFWCVYRGAPTFCVCLVCLLFILWGEMTPKCYPLSWSRPLEKLPFPGVITEWVSARPQIESVCERTSCKDKHRVPNFVRPGYSHCLQVSSPTSSSQRLDTTNCGTTVPNVRLG